MDFIRNLKHEQFSIFNVNLKKVPIDRFERPLDEWNFLTREELYFHHNMNSLLWGMKMGERKWAFYS
jgi:hypothetical protein